MDLATKDRGLIFLLFTVVTRYWNISLEYYSESKVITLDNFESLIEYGILILLSSFYSNKQIWILLTSSLSRWHSLTIQHKSSLHLIHVIHFLFSGVQSTERVTCWCFPFGPNYCLSLVLINLAFNSSGQYGAFLFLHPVLMVFLTIENLKAKKNFWKY